MTHVDQLNGLNLFFEDFNLPCEEMSHVFYKHLDIDDFIVDMFGVIDMYTLQIAYPEKFKIITQKQDIDIHALIGNIGGYIGLFLGKQNF